jgi:hypothetical protein
MDLRRQLQGKVPDLIRHERIDHRKRSGHLSIATGGRGLREKPDPAQVA